MKRSLISVSALAILAFGACTPSNPEPASDPAAQPSENRASDLESLASEILAASYPADGPGVAAIITKDNETVFIGAHGLADIESATPISETSVFRLASITKQIAAATLMLLVEDGLVDLDAPISTYLPDYPEPGASISVRRLLNHTSGIPSYTSIPGWMIPANTDRAQSTAEMIDVFANLPADFEPGEQWRYNNSAYLLVGAIIEAVTGEPWADVVDARISTPLALDVLGSGLLEADTNGFVVGYTRSDSPRASQQIHMSVPHAAGALISDVQDLADWANAFHDLEVVNEASYAQMIAPTILNDGEEIDYGFGLELGTILGNDTIGHSGGIFGFSTDSVYVPSADVFVGVLVNSDSPSVRPGTTMLRLAALALDTPLPVFLETDFDLSTLETAFGVYKSDEVTRSFFGRDGELFTFREGGTESQVFSAGDNKFFYGPNSLSWFELNTNETPATMSFYSSESVAPDVLEWSEPIPDALSVDPAILETYLGIYVLDIPPMAVIAAQDGDLANGISIQLTGQPAFPLEVISDTEFAVRSVGAVIRFGENENGEMGLEIDQGGGTYTGTLAEED